MSELLKGNFKVEKEVTLPEVDEAEKLKQEFEKTAMRRLGGSIAFASPKKGFLWTGDTLNAGNNDAK